MNQDENQLLENNRTWHDKHIEELSFHQRLADKLAAAMGSWSFILAQTFFVLIWMGFNLAAYLNHWDPYPFILLNLLFSTQAAYAAPIIMMSQNRQNQRDRYQATEDYKTNLKAEQEIKQIQAALEKLEKDKIDLIIKKINELTK